LLNLNFGVQHLLGLLREVRRLHLAVEGHLSKVHLHRVVLLLLDLLERRLVHEDHVIVV